MGQGGVGLGGQVGWEQRSEACVKSKKKKKLGELGGGGESGGLVGGGGGRVDGNGELKLL